MVISLFAHHLIISSSHHPIIPSSHHPMGGHTYVMHGRLLLGRCNRCNPGPNRRRSRLFDTTPSTSLARAENSPTKTNLPLHPVVISNNGPRGQTTKSSTHSSSPSTSWSSLFCLLLLPLLHPPGPSSDSGRRLDSF